MSALEDIKESECPTCHGDWDMWPCKTCGNPDAEQQRFTRLQESRTALMTAAVAYGLVEDEANSIPETRRAATKGALLEAAKNFYNVRK